ncbi:MAG: anti-sigma factor family protein [Planctomycetota bacterium]|jgi:anti-sigma factor RsiW
MPDALDQSQILAYVEGELSTEEAAAVRVQLARHPEVLAGVDRLRQDRAGLRGLAEPGLPRDFVAGLEPLLARPMLIETQPGAYRRSRRRSSAGRWAAGVGIAAGLTIVIGTGLLLVLNGFSGGGTSDDGVDGMRAADVDARRTGAERGPAADRRAAPGDVLLAGAPLDGAIHHALPPRVVATGVDPAMSAPSTSGQPRSGQPFVATAPFCVELVMAGDVETNLVGLIGGSRQLALVQNFTLDEAARIESEWLRENGGRQPARPVVADSSGGAASDEAIRELARRLREQISVNAGDQGRGDVSRRLAGARALAASYEQQLRFAAIGATHTITVPLADLQHLLVAMNGLPNGTTMLRPLDDDAEAVAPTLIETDWGTSLQRIRAALAELEAAHPDAHVLLPVVLTAAE